MPSRFNAAHFVSFQWIGQPARPNDKRNLYGDLACFVMLTPLAGVSSWLCLSGAIHYSKFEKTKWETAGLITLAVFLILIYAVWCMVSSCQVHFIGFFFLLTHVVCHAQNQIPEVKTCKFERFDT